MGTWEPSKLGHVDQTYYKNRLSRYDNVMTTRRVKLVHTSDVHLDGRVRSESADGFRNSAERAFARVIDVALAELADLLLIVGDLFDHGRVSEEDFDFVRIQLGRLACPVVLLPGNHDVHDERSVWHRIEFEADGRRGGHVHLLLETDGDCLEFKDIGVRVWGRAMREHAPENVPLQGVPPRHRELWNVGLAHGQVVEQRVGMASSQITHDEIRESGFDYLALGHVHVWREHSQGDTKAYYPGSPVAAYASQDGGHVAIATLCPERGVSVARRQVDQPEAPERRASSG